jgi:hypothetical protein
MDNVLFDVKKVPLIDLGIKNPVASGINHAILGRDDRILSFCSEDYQLIPNRDIVEGFSQFFTQQRIGFTPNFRSFDGCRFKMQFALDKFKINLGTKDKPDWLTPCVYVYNSYNRTLRFQFGIEVMRLVCSNGLTISETVKSLSKLHTSHSVKVIDECFDLIASYEAHYEEIMESYEDLKMFPVKNLSSRIKDVIDEIKFPVFLGEFAQDRAMREHIEHGLEANDWLVYNSLNYTLNHYADHLLGRKAEDLDRKVLNYLLTS